jgi:Fe-S-cluster containining protein
MRQCGSCGLCCKLVGIKDLNKPMNQWCKHWKRGLGCTVYESRPVECDRFTCLWLSGKIPGRLKPMKTGIIAYLDNRLGLVLQENDNSVSALHVFAEEIEIWRQRHINVSVIGAGLTEAWSAPEIREGIFV